MDTGDMLEPKGGRDRTSASCPFQGRSERRGGEEPRQLRRRGLLITASVLALLIVGCSLFTVMTEVPDSDGAVEFSVDGISYFVADETSKEARVIGGSGPALIIPATVEYGGVQYKVTTLDPLNLREKTHITSITAPDSITSIPDMAFIRCTNLQSIDFPGVVTIKDQAFFGCTSLQNIHLPKVVTIGQKAFEGCTGLTSVPFPDSVTFIGDRAFAQCTGLTSLTIHGSGTSLGKNAFIDCKNIKTLDFQGVASIGYGAFNFCTGLGDITIPDVKSICDFAFERCYNLNTFTVLGSETSIGTRAFDMCVNLKSADLQGVTSIGMSAFANCRSLHTINISDAKTIESYAFENCGNLKSVVIPDSATLGMKTFGSCTSIQSISFGKDISAKFAKIWAIPITDAFDVKSFVDESGNQLNASDMSQFQGRTFTGTMEKMVRVADSAVATNIGSTVKDGYIFIGWNDGTKMLKSSDKIVLSESITLSAVWEAVKPMVPSGDTAPNVPGKNL